MKGNNYLFTIDIMLSLKDALAIYINVDNRYQIDKDTIIQDVGINKNFLS